MQPIVFQIAETSDMVAFVTESILAGVVLGMIISLINMASSRD